MTTAEPWQTRTPDLIADVCFYPSTEGGKKSSAVLGYGCPCFIAKDLAVGGWDARLQLGDHPFEPGTERRVGFVFLAPEGAEEMRRAGRFFLWDGGFVGEASVVK